MTQFGISLWAYELTGSTEVLGIMGACTYGSTILASPIAGTLIDRRDRKSIMVTSDAIDILALVAMLICVHFGYINVPLLAVLGVVIGVIEAFRQPSYMASVSLLVPEQKYGRANGMLELIYSVSDLMSPLMAGIFLGFVDISGLLLIDLVTSIVGLVTIYCAQIPQPEATDEGGHSFIGDCFWGFRYIWRRQGLLKLLALFMFANIVLSSYEVLGRPALLEQTDFDTLTVGFVQSVCGIGGVLGGIVAAAWGGFKKKVYTAVGFVALSMAGVVIFAIGGSPVFWSIGAFTMGLATPVFSSSNFSIWMKEVEASVQGRVFAARRMGVQVTIPLSMLLYGSLADRIVTPQSRAVSAVHWLVGSGGASGMRLIMIVVSLIGVLVALFSLVDRKLRGVETDRRGESEHRPIGGG
jgi:MFS family permease